MSASSAPRSADAIAASASLRMQSFSCAVNTRRRRRGEKDSRRAPLTARLCTRSTRGDVTVGTNPIVRLHGCAGRDQERNTCLPRIQSTLESESSARTSVADNQIRSSRHVLGWLRAHSSDGFGASGSSIASRRSGRVAGFFTRRPRSAHEICRRASRRDHV